MKIQIENLRAKMRGENLNTYQTSLALAEYYKLLDYVDELEQLTIPAVVGRSEQLKCEHKGRRTATELVEYCEDCKKILYHP